MKCKIENREIAVSIPFTRPTGKIRIKRPIKGQIAAPVACRSEIMQPQDYLEWQISYDTDDLTMPSVVPEVVLRKPQGIRYGVELVRLIVEARRLNMLTESQIKNLQDTLDSNEPGIEETEPIIIKEVEQSDNIGTRFGFDRYQLLIPGYLKSKSDYSVEIRISSKQRAVGTQSMVYLNLPVSKCLGESGLPLVGRRAEQNENAMYRITKKNSGLVFDTILAFAIASLDHRRDIKLIFEALGI